MARPPSPPPPVQWPLPLLTPACYNRISSMNANNRSSQYSRPNSEMRFSTPFPTCEVGYSRPYGSFGVGPHRRRIEQVGGREDNGNCQNRGPMMKMKEECRKNESEKKEKKKKWKKKNKKENGGSEKKEEGCYVPNLPPGILLPMEWPYPDSF
ncbi:hypothetical protein TSUD_340450 [Trifolium subterraneum]|uniref:Uncharacterized protein n=1 Tax=Trifolium subterraneum TaxID=3900 RepID=A0A2Z6LNB0_TRISU|nr:hypothetical protein TSUD_340450 [Trifolium subterraneum]